MVFELCVYIHVCMHRGPCRLHGSSSILFCPFPSGPGPAHDNVERGFKVLLTCKFSCPYA